jgi:hypothetical protein
LRFVPQPLGSEITTTGAAFVIEGANVTLRGFNLHYPSPPHLNPSGGNLPAIQIVGTSGVLIEDVTIQFAFGGVDCVASSVECDHVIVAGMPSLSGIPLTQLPYGFCAEPGDGDTSLDGLSMRIRDSHVEIGRSDPPSGIVAFMLIPPYPEMTVDSASPKQIHDGFRIMAGTNAVSGNSGILRVRNTSCEADARPVFIDGGSVAQISHLNDDDTGFDGMFFSPNFSGVAVLAGHHFGQGGPSGYAIEIGQSQHDPTGSGEEIPSSAVVSVIDTIASRANIFVSLTASGSVVFNTVALQQSGPSIVVGALSAGPVAVVGGSLYTGMVNLSGTAAPPFALEASTADNAGQIGLGVTLENSPPFNPAGVMSPAAPTGNPYSAPVAWPASMMPRHSRRRSPCCRPRDSRSACCRRSVAVRWICMAARRNLPNRPPSMCAVLGPSAVPRNWFR